MNQLDSLERPIDNKMHRLLIGSVQIEERKML